MFIGYSGLIVNFHRSLFLMSYRIKDPVQFTTYCELFELLWPPAKIEVQFLLFGSSWQGNFVMR